VKACLELAAPLVAGTELKRDQIAARLDRGHLDATTLMEYLISRGMPQRTAHHATGELVRKALDRGVRLADLALEDFQAADASLDKSVYKVLGPEQAVASFVSYGSTGREQVAAQVARWKKQLGL
jgi:argininosuccinate lyase